jgi:hypothetical protein
MIFVGLLITNGNFLAYAQEEYEYIGQNFIGNNDYLYSTPQNSLSTIQPLQHFPVTTLPPSPQTYSQQSPPPLPIQNVQLSQQVTVEICSNGIDDDRDGLIDEVGCTFQQQQQQQIFPAPTPIIPILPRPQPPQQSPISQCEVYTLTVRGTSDLAKARKNIDSNTDLTFEISSILVPYDRDRIGDELVSGKLYIDKDKSNEKELNYHIKKITNDCKVIAYLDDDDDDDNNHDDNNHD